MNIKDSKVNLNKTVIYFSCQSDGCHIPVFWQMLARVSIRMPTAAHLTDAGVINRLKLVIFSCLAETGKINKC